MTGEKKKDAMRMAPQPEQPAKRMTPEERQKRNEDAFVWKEGDIEILDPGNPADDEDFEDLMPEDQPKTPRSRPPR
jgi:hypothetical protein